jgi:hypothetical protein
MRCIIRQTPNMFSKRDEEEAVGSAQLLGRFAAHRQWMYSCICRQQDFARTTFLALFGIMMIALIQVRGAVWDTN